MRAAASAPPAGPAPRRPSSCWNAPNWDQPLLGELAKVMTSASICGLGQAAMNPIKQIMKHFPEDLT